LTFRGADLLDAAQMGALAGLRPCRDLVVVQGKMIASQSETHRVKRDECRGRLWLRSLARRQLTRLNQPPPITISVSRHGSEG